jgi:hypothetical protein
MSVLTTIVSPRPRATLDCPSSDLPERRIAGRHEGTAGQDDGCARHVHTRLGR